MNIIINAYKYQCYHHRFVEPLAGRTLPLSLTLSVTTERVILYVT